MAVHVIAGQPAYLVTMECSIEVLHDDQVIRLGDCAEAAEPLRLERMTHKIEALADHIELAEAALAAFGELTLAEYVEQLKQGHALLQRRQDSRTRPCRHCGHPVVVPDGDDRPWHLKPSGKISDRGCRAASWERRAEEGLTGHDESLSTEVYAQ